MLKKIIFLLIVILYTASCAETFDSVKRGITGTKGNSADEFLIKKKDPLVLPPDFENLPTPGQTSSSMEEISIFEETLGSSIEDSSSTTTSTENSILKKIQSK
jgi:hypothetical protein